MKKFLQIGILAALMLVVAAPAFAQPGAPAGGIVPPQPAPINNANEQTIYTILDRVITIVFYVLMFLAILFILIAAFNYLTAAGNAEKVEKAQQQLLYAIIAIVIAVLARSIPWIVAKFVASNVGITSY